MWRPPQHGLTFMRQRVTGAHGDANLRHEQTFLPRKRSDFCKWPLQVLLDVISQGLQRRDIKNLRTINQIACKGSTDQRINAGEKGSQGLAGPGGR